MYLSKMKISIFVLSSIQLPWLTIVPNIVCCHLHIHFFCTIFTINEATILWSTEKLPYNDTKSRWGLLPGESCFWWNYSNEIRRWFSFSSLLSIIVVGFILTSFEVEYPLVTHDPNMLEKKSRGNLLGKLKCLFQKGIGKISGRNSSYSTRLCTILA